MIRRVAKKLLEFYATRVPYHRGKWRVIERAVRWSGVEEMDRGQVFEVERAGLKWRLETACSLQRKLYYHGVFDIHDQRALLGRVPRGGVFFDVGAYFGYYSMLAAQRGARVFSFEPVRANFDLLARNRALNHFDQINASQVALSDAAGRVSFALPGDENRGRGRLADGAESGVVEVEAMTLDAFAREHAIDRLDALKLDVEGAELKVLAGGRETIVRFQPAMLIELNPPALARFGATGDELLAAVRALGYAIFRVDARGVREFSGLERGEDYTNIFCLPR